MGLVLGVRERSGEDHRILVFEAGIGSFVGFIGMRNAGSKPHPSRTMQRTIVAFRTRKSNSKPPRCRPTKSLISLGSRHTPLALIVSS
jgi:hypothetical protein